MVHAFYNYFNDSEKLSLLSSVGLKFVKNCIKFLTSSDLCFMFYVNFLAPSEEGLIKERVRF
jgi:hypothetical protein